MTFIPIDRMRERVHLAQQDSDTTLFLQLMYFGEMIVKLTAAGLVSAVQPDRDRHRYRLVHRLVRADSLGEWTAVTEDILTGPAATFLSHSARAEQRELTEKSKDGTWQYEAVRLLNSCLKQVIADTEQIPSRVDARRWFSTFVHLRNSTRGHGVTHGGICSKISPPLERSIDLVSEHFCLFHRPWAYLHRNLSGRYRISKLTESSKPFDPLKSDGSRGVANGLYTHFDDIARVEIVDSDPELSDFFFPNGAFTGKRYELISYISGNTKGADATPYLTPATELPPSQTQGIGELEVQGNCFGNLPPMHMSYVSRPALEAELSGKLSDDRHPVITLHGRGGIGKTSLALRVLHSLSKTDRFAAMLWFSARDIDLLADGPKVVRPHVLTEGEIAKELVDLTQPREATASGFSSIKYLSDTLSSSPFGGPLVFVFDNFETVRSPADLYAWIDTYIRPPNKVLITTRFRDFKGDYPLEVPGMSENESSILCEETAIALGIRRLLTTEYIREVYAESEGHPYVIKILLAGC
jgi:NB-ARC domain